MSAHPELDLLSAYLDAELPATDRAHLDDHVASCAECTRTLAVLGATIAETRALPEVDMTPEQIARLDAAIARERTRPATRRTSRMARFAWAGGAVAA